MRVLILCADASSNSLVRVYPIAKVLQRNHEVIVSGFRSGPEIFGPYADEFDYQTLRVEPMPKFVSQVWELARVARADLVYAFKPLSTSMWPGLAVRRRLSIPLVVDIEDWELGWYLDRGRVGLMKHARHVNYPNGVLTTALNEGLVQRTDHRFVASTFLQRRFGGTVLRHGPDTEEFSPQRVSRVDAISELKLADLHYVLFAGTPMPNKGLEDVLLTIENLNRPDVRLLLVGSMGHNPTFGRYLQDRFGQVMTLLDPRPHREMPLFLAAASMVILAQKPSRETASQIPGKVFEAMAMGLPIVATAVSDLPEILDGCGIVVPPSDRFSLEAALRRLLADDSFRTQLGNAARERCIQRYGWAAMEEVLERDLARLVAV